MNSSGAQYGLIRRAYRSILPAWPCVNWLEHETSGCLSLLDLGCGDHSPVQYLKVPFSVGVDIHLPYLREDKRLNFHSQYILADITRLELKSKSFDAVIATEVLEHLPKPEGYALLQKMERLARKRVIVTVPNGYLYQDGYDNNPFQEHKSGWSVADMRSLGFRVRGHSGWKRLRGYQGGLRYKPAFLWLRLSDLSQLLIGRFPQSMFGLFAVKDL